MSSIEHLVQATDFVIESLAGDGSGTETLPREADNDNPSTKEQRPTILLIDDDAADRRVIERMLQTHYTVAGSCSGEEGVERFRDLRPDCVLVDYNLPDTSGVAVIGNLKKYDPHAGVIMLTGQGDEVIAAEAMRYGAYYYISKDNVNGDILSHFITNAMVFTRAQRKSSVQKLLLENYTAVLAQEVTAPLETIRRYLRFMRTDQQTTLSHSSRDAMDAITNILDTLKNSTQFLADCTTLENFAQAVPCPLTTTIETALENLACKAHGSKLSFSYGDLPMIRMNRWKCLLIIQNLFDLMMNIAASGTPAEVEVEANIRGERGILSLSAPKQLFDPASLKTLYWLQSAPYFESGFHEYSMEFAPFMLVRAVATYCRDELHISEEEDQLLIRYHFPVNR